MICNDVIVDSRSDSANCGGCGNVCQSGFECVNSACKRISSMTSSTTITCNAQTVKPYSDRLNCTGCGIACGNYYYCKEGSCTSLPSIGSTITFGHYEQDNNTSNGKEPIEWRVLERKSNGQLLVISEKVLDVKPYNTTSISITWEKSTIRSWLNGYGASYNTVGTDFTSENFINTAFTAAEKAKIVSSNVLADPNPNYNTAPGNETTDKIFLLSIKEAKNTNYFANNASRQADATRYAVKQGVYVIGDVHCYATWWLRSPCGNEFLAAFVHRHGYVLNSGDNVDNDDLGVRPALLVQ
jgi:hypothetical protein